MENDFNLITQPWIPISNYGLVSLKEVFSNKEYKTLGGDSVTKLSILRLLLAIAQSAVPLETDQQWHALGTEGLSDKCLKYLEKWYDRFNLYGKHPFLQLPTINKAREQPFAALLPAVSSGNTTILTQLQVPSNLTEAEKARLLINQMSFALSGKKTDNSAVLSPSYKGKTKSNGKPTSGATSTGMAFMGLLHNYLVGECLLDTIWFNLLTEEDLAETNMFKNGMGRPAWELMPTGEDDEIAQQIQSTYIGRLIPLCRFCLLGESGVHYSEGIAHLDYKAGMWDFSATIDRSKKDPKMKWTDPEKKPWRELTALLAFLDANNSTVSSYQLQFGMRKVEAEKVQYGLWSAGLRVSSNAGEQYVSGSDDAVDSLLWLPDRTNQDDRDWFSTYKNAIEDLDKLSKILYGSVIGYFKFFKKDGAATAKLASNTFWQLADKEAQALILSCDDEQAMQTLLKTYISYVKQVFNQYCPNETAKQLEAWAECKPNLVKFLKGNKE